MEEKNRGGLFLKKIIRIILIVLDLAAGFFLLIIGLVSSVSFIEFLSSLIYIIPSLILFFIGYSLTKNKKWAWILSIIVSFACIYLLFNYCLLLKEKSRIKKISSELNLSSMSCEELEKRFSDESEKLDTCQVDKDCSLTRGNCPYCINNKISTDMYKAIEEALYETKCRERSGPIASCVAVDSCRCVNHRCKEIFK